MAENFTLDVITCLKALMSRKGLHQQSQLARSIDVDQGTISKWLRGETRISDAYKKAIARTFNCPGFVYLPDSKHSFDAENAGQILNRMDWNNPEAYINLNHAAQGCLNENDVVLQFCRLIPLRCVPDDASNAHTEVMVKLIRGVEDDRCLSQAIEKIRKAHREHFHDWNNCPHFYCFRPSSDFLDMFYKRGAYESCFWTMNKLRSQLHELERIVLTKKATFILIPERLHNRDWVWISNYETVAAVKNLFISLDSLGLNFGFNDHLAQRLHESFRKCTANRESEYIFLSNEKMAIILRFCDVLSKLEENMGIGTPPGEWKDTVDHHLPDFVANLSLSPTGERV